MEAGRELDRLIAETVMGFTRNSDHYGEIPFKDAEGNPVYGDFLDASSSMKLPHYSTDIRAAWKVVERIKGYMITIMPFYLKWDTVSDMWEAGFKSSSGENDISIQAETAPCAICLAALEAINYPSPAR